MLISILIIVLIVTFPFIIYFIYAKIKKISFKEGISKDNFIFIECLMLFVSLTMFSVFFYSDEDSYAFFKIISVTPLFYIAAKSWVMHTIDVTEKECDSKYEYYVDMYDRYLKNKIKHYKLKYKHQKSGEICYTYCNGLDKEDVYPYYKALVKANYGVEIEQEFIPITTEEYNTVFKYKII